MSYQLLISVASNGETQKVISTGEYETIKETKQELMVTWDDVAIKDPKARHGKIEIFKEPRRQEDGLECVAEMVGTVSDGTCTMQIIVKSVNKNLQ